MSDQNEWQFDLQAESSRGQARRRSGGASTRTMADLLFLPEMERSLMNWLVRQKQTTLAEVAAHFGQPESAIQPLLNELTAQGFIQKVEQVDTCHYQPNLMSRKERNVPTNIWNALE